VTIVHSGDALLSATYPDKYRNALESRCRARNINIVFNEYVDNFPEAGSVGFTTRSGKEFPSADLVVRNICSFILSHSLIKQLYTDPSVRLTPKHVLHRQPWTGRPRSRQLRTRQPDARDPRTPRRVRSRRHHPLEGVQAGSQGQCAYRRRCC